MHIDVTERQGSCYDSILIKDPGGDYAGTGSAGGIMVPTGGSFQYILNTRNYEGQTLASNGKFFRSCVGLNTTSSPGVPVGLEDVVLESK